MIRDEKLSKGKGDKRRSKSDPFYGVNHVKYLDKMIVKSHFMNRGLTEARRPMKQLILHETGLFIINLLAVIRLSSITACDEKSTYFSQLVLYFGDGYIGHPSRKVMLLLFLVAQVCFWLVKLTTLWCELNDDMKIMDEFGVVIKTGFDPVALKLPYEHCKKYQRLSHIILANLKVITIVVSIAVSFIHIFMTLSCWHFLDGLKAKILVFIWGMFVVAMCCIHATASLTGAALILYGFGYIKLRHDAVISALNGLTKFPVCPKPLLKRNIQDQIKVYNLIDLTNMVSRPVLFITFVPLTLSADLIFFFVTFYGVDNAFTSYVAAVIILTSVGGFALGVYFIGNIHSKSSTANKQLHKLIIHTPFEIRVNLKYLLENASNLMLFACNFRRS